jgi:hypothetical protein
VPALHVHYSLYVCSHHTMYRTVSPLLWIFCGCKPGSVIRQLIGLRWFSAMILKMGSAEPAIPQKGNRVFRETKMCNCGNVLLAVLNCMYELQFVWRNSAVIITSLTARWQSIATAVQKLLDSVVSSFTSSPQTVDVSCHEVRRRFFTWNVHRI